MAFLMDRQTFADLEIFESNDVNQTVFKYFDRAVSRGGREELLDMFFCPLSDISKIQERQEIIHYVYKEKLSFPIDKYLLDFIEYYLLLSNKPVKVSRFDAWHKYLKYKLQPTNDYYIIQRGI